MTIGFERQELRALALLPIRQLPPYEVDYVAACRVGKAVVTHTTGLLNGPAEWSLAICLSESALHDAGGVPFSPSTGQF